MDDVANATLRALSCLFGQSNGTQVGQVLQAAFESLEQNRGWSEIEHCCWFAQKAVDWTQYQYRYAVPTRLVERLTEEQDAPVPLPLHLALAAMIKTVFISPTPLVNLSTSDIIANLMTVVLRRVAIDPEDSLLPCLVECIAALGTHVYYADQIHDLACELISRLLVVDTNGSGRVEDSGGKYRSGAIRCLLAGLVGLISATDESEAASDSGNASADKDQKYGSIPATVSDIGSSVARESAVAEAKHSKLPKRSRVPADVWQDTLPLLCDADFDVRADYAKSLVTFLRSEVASVSPVSKDMTGNIDAKIVLPLTTDERARRVQSILSSITSTDSLNRFLNALHVSVYFLATSSALGLALSSAPPSPDHDSTGDDSQGTINVIPPSPLSEEQDFTVLDELRELSPSHRSISRTAPTLKWTLARRLLAQATHHTSTATTDDSSATAPDYENILFILTAVHEKLSHRALLCGVPMLVSLSRAAKFDDVGHPGSSRRRYITETVNQIWLVIGRIWDCQELIDLAQKV